MRIRTNDRRGSQSNETEKKYCCSIVLVIEHNWNGTFRWVRLVRLTNSIELIELNRRDPFDFVGQKNKTSCTAMASVTSRARPLPSPFFFYNKLFTDTDSERALPVAAFNHHFYNCLFHWAGFHFIRPLRHLPCVWYSGNHITYLTSTPCFRGGHVWNQMFDC